MKSLTNSLKKAIIELLILKLLSEGDMYGYQLTQEFRKRSGGRFTLLEGSMYPILYRLTDSGCISSYDKKAGKRLTRVYYHMEPNGAARYQELLAEYQEAVETISFLLTSKEGDHIE